MAAGAAMTLSAWAELKVGGIRRLFPARRTMAEWITAKGDGRTPATFEFLLTFRASGHCLCQEGFKIVDVKVNVNRRPVSLIATNVIGSLGRFASR
jgi:hypothetical protein